MKSAVPVVTALPAARRTAVSVASAMPGEPLLSFHASSSSDGNPWSAHVSSAERMYTRPVVPQR